MPRKIRKHSDTTTSGIRSFSKVLSSEDCSVTVVVTGISVVTLGGGVVPGVVPGVVASA